MEIVTIILWLGAVIFIVAGISGLIVPAIPGPTFLFIGLVLAAWAEDFNYIGWGTVIALLILTGLSFLIDYIAGILGAKKSGASRQAMFGALIGTFVGIFFGFIGIFVGPFIGAFIGEYLVQKKSGAATQVGVGVLIGVVAGIATKIAIGLTMVGVFLVVRFF